MGPPRAPGSPASSHCGLRGAAAELGGALRCSGRRELGPAGGAREAEAQAAEPGRSDAAEDSAI